jgi:Fe-S-cluster formation regulator IscX/YfhJ
MPDNSVALETFQQDKSELKLSQPRNMQDKLVALETFQRDTSELKTVQPLNMEDKLVALETFQRDTSELKAVQFQNMSDKSVALETFQQDKSELKKFAAAKHARQVDCIGDIPPRQVGTEIGKGPIAIRIKNEGKVIDARDIPSFHDGRVVTAGHDVVDGGHQFGLRVYHTDGPWERVAACVAGKGTDKVHGECSLFESSSSS